MKIAVDYYSVDWLINELANCFSALVTPIMTSILLFVLNIFSPLFLKPHKAKQKQKKKKEFLSWIWIIAVIKNFLSMLFTKMRSCKKQNVDYWVFSGQFSPSVIHVFLQICYGHHWRTKPSAAHRKAVGNKISLPSWYESTIAFSRCLALIFFFPPFLLFTLSNTYTFSSACSAFSCPFAVHIHSLCLFFSLSSLSSSLFFSLALLQFCSLALHWALLAKR